MRSGSAQPKTSESPVSATPSTRGALQQHAHERMPEEDFPATVVADIELLGHEPGRSTSASIPLIEPTRFEMIALLVFGEREEEIRTGGRRPRPRRAAVVRTKAIDVLLFDKLGFNGDNRSQRCADRSTAAPPDSGEQQGLHRSEDRPVPSANDRQDAGNPKRRRPGSHRQAHSSDRNANSAASAAIARSPETQVRRECAQRFGSISQIPASGSCQRDSIADTAISTAFQWPTSRRSHMTMPLQTARAPRRMHRAGTAD